jgi:hypothetical protein
MRNFFVGNAQPGTIYLYGMPQTNEASPTKTRGETACSFPVSISVWVNCDEREMDVIGNFHLEKIRNAIEVDERLSGLVVSYEITDEAVLYYSSGIIDIEIIVMFSYYRDTAWASSSPP